MPSPVQLSICRIGGKFMTANTRMPDRYAFAFRYSARYAITTLLSAIGTRRPYS